MKICVFGNSHIAALHLGWKQVAAEFPEVEIRFFGSANAEMADVSFESGALIATTEAVAADMMRTGGADRITLADYDLLVIVGCRIGIKGCFQLVRPARLHSAEARDGQNNQRAAGTLISRRFLHGVIEDMVRKSRVRYFVDSISEGTRLPIVFIATPFPSAHAMEEPQNRRLGRATQDGWGAAFVETFWSALDSGLGGNARVFPQPPETIVHQLFTLQAYSLVRKGVDADNQAVEIIDDVHMNAGYGALVMKRLLDDVIGNGR